MKLEAFIEVDTTMSTANNSYDDDSGDSIAEYLYSTIKDCQPTVVIPCELPDNLGTANFKIEVYGIYDYRNFLCSIRAIADIDLNIDIKIAEDLFYKDNKWTKNILTPKLSKGFSDYITKLNSNLNIYIPYKETFIFDSEFNEFYIRMDPTAPYAPEFVKFSLDEYINEDDIENELLVYN